MKICLFDPITSLGPLVRDMAGELGFKGGPELVLPPMKIAGIAASLRKQGHEPSVVDPYPMGLDREATLRVLEERGADVYIGEVTLASIEEDIPFLKALSERVSSPVIPMTSLRYGPLLRRILKETGAPYCLCGEVDLLVGRILSGSVEEGTARLDGDDLVATYPRIEDLDRLPLPARDLLPNERYRYHEWAPITTVKSSRGCPFPCAEYCPYPMTEGRTWRGQSPARLLEELEDISRRGIPFVYFRDTNFTYNRKRLLEVCRGIKERGIPLRWICETRANCLDREMLAAMHEAGCICVNIGVETGDASLMERFAKRGVGVGQVVRLKRQADRLGIRQQYLFMVGLPGETRRSLYQTLLRMLRIEPIHIGINLLNPYPGTELYERAERKGWIEVREWSRYDGGDSPIMRTDELSLYEIMQARRWLFHAFRLSKSDAPADRAAFLRLKKDFKEWARAGEKISRRPPAVSTNRRGKVRWGILGCARIAQESLIPALREAGNAEVSAIASRDPHKAREWAERYEIPRAYGSYEELLRDPEVQAVYIPLPNHLHGAWTRRAAELGKHVLCEKPLAPTAAEAAGIVRFCRERGVLLMEAFMYRFHPQHARVRELIEMGRIGEPKQIVAAFSFFMAPGDDIRLHAEMGGGCLLDVGCYCVNVSRLIFGAEPWGVFGWSRVHPERRVDMSCWAEMRFPGGRAALFGSSFEMAFEQTYTVKGTEGTIHVPHAYLPPYPATPIVVNGETVEVHSRNQFALEVEGFSEAVLRFAPVPYPLEDTIDNMKVLDAIAESARRGAPAAPGGSASGVGRIWRKLLR